MDESKDNRALVDNNTAQSLTGEDINALRRLDIILYCLSWPCAC